jgi:hypothetical protein
MRDRLKEINYKAVLFGLVILVTLATSGWSMAILLMGFGTPWYIAIPSVMVFDGAGLYFGTTAMEYATSDDSGFSDKVVTWLVIGLSIAINGYHGWMVAPVFGVVLGSSPAITGLMFHSNLRQRNLEALRGKGRLAKAMPHYPTLHWMLYPKDTFRDFKKIVGFRRDALTTRAINEEKETIIDGISYNNVQHAIRENLTDNITLDEMMGIVVKHFPEVTKARVSSSMSTERKRRGGKS